MGAVRPKSLVLIENDNTGDFKYDGLKINLDFGPKDSYLLVIDLTNKRTCYYCKILSLNHQSSKVPSYKDTGIEN